MHFNSFEFLTPVMYAGQAYPESTERRACSRENPSPIILPDSGECRFSQKFISLRPGGCSVGAYRLEMTGHPSRLQA
jgi:hypothetical protein